MHRRLTTLLAASAVALLTVLGLASPAAAVTRDQKLSVMYSWTQTSASSYNAWNSARLNKGAWSAYAFDWSTDYCSSSPDNPLGFPFNLSCYRHDFGYRNHKAMGVFTSANKSRLDSAFYEDLKRVCNGYSGASRTACNSLAWTYYQAVKAFGSRAAVSPAEIERAAKIMSQDQRTVGLS